MKDTKPIYTKNNIQLFQGNCLEIMDELYEEKGKCINLIFADPPYFLSNGGITCKSGKMVKVDKGSWDKSEGTQLNHEFNLAWLERCQKLLTDNGTIFVSGTHHVIYSIGFAMQELEFKLLNTITWEKPNPPPNLSRKYFTHSTEMIIWASKNANSKHLFNYEEMRKINGGKQMKDVWNLTSPSKNEKAFGKHPTQKPIKLLNRLILAATQKKDVILDPFNGSGTTGVSTVNLERSYIGIEQNKEFCELSIQRFENIHTTITT